MRAIISGVALLALTACDPAIPDSGPGIGFDNPANSPQMRERREAAVTGNALPPAQAVSEEALATLERTQPETSRPAERSNLENVASEDADGGTNGISDENDFQAVEDRRTIETDAERMARLRQQYKVIQPEAMPERSDTGPNIVDYALSTTNPVGTRIYNRLGFNAEARFRRNCARYASPDKAQIAFLSLGGPEVDRRGLDPDGDGYACDWDPTPFRRAVSSD
ncbi:hypothetical protein SAMN04490248_106176 [Salinihabitans flavidus]|uniref:Excalibur calcium-binding domain-containing protein n=1 Tax=Salinihabitans flavidus TaxID=569882 RepID=A0A1H8QJF5_9RHOB|nr:hypothetical protein [Salinihabitans flavidus]SEO53933.1 hypothetical protein SAMN04490248_106176 [Salinihabitans flavidus]